MSVLQIAGSRLTLAIDGEGKVSARVLQNMSALTLQLPFHGIYALRYFLGAGMPEALSDMGTGMPCCNSQSVMPSSLPWRLAVSAGETRKSLGV